MADKSPAEKLRLKPGMSAALLHIPSELEGALGVPDDVTLATTLPGADFVLDFATTLAESEERLAAIAPVVSDKTVVWIGYPKGSKAAGYDVSRDTIMASARAVGMTANANFSIDAKWSAVRVRPLRPGE